MLQVLQLLNKLEPSFSSSRNDRGGSLRDDPNNGYEGDYRVAEGCWNAMTPWMGCLPFVRINQLNNGKGFSKISKPNERNGAYHSQFSLVFISFVLSVLMLSSTCLPIVATSLVFLWMYR